VASKRFPRSLFTRKESSSTPIQFRKGASPDLNRKNMRRFGKGKRPPEENDRKERRRPWGKKRVFPVGEKRGEGGSA